VGLAWCAAPLQARPRPDLETAPSTESIVAAPAQDLNAPRQISLEQAIQIAQSRYPGRVVRADTKTQGDRVIHEIRILGEDSRVRTVRIDAQGGELR
jgi:uncharacterized membrane protein YkoI